MGPRPFCSVHNQLFAPLLHLVLEQAAQRGVEFKQAAVEHLGRRVGDRRDLGEAALDMGDLVGREHGVGPFLECATRASGSGLPVDTTPRRAGIGAYGT